MDRTVSGSLAVTFFRVDLTVQSILYHLFIKISPQFLSFIAQKLQILSNQPFYCRFLIA